MSKVPNSCTTETTANHRQSGSAQKGRRGKELRRLQASIATYYRSPALSPIEPDYLRLSKMQRLAVGIVGTILIFEERLDGHNRSVLHSAQGGCAMRTMLLVLTLGLGLSACATKYGEMGLTGGVKAEQVTSDIWRVIARGNGYTESSRVGEFCRSQSTIQRPTAA